MDHNFEMACQSLREFVEKRKAGRDEASFKESELAAVMVEADEFLLGKHGILAMDLIVR